jgi:hypothetical protein
VSTPFDTVISDIAAAGYHNHRLEAHSDTVSNGIVSDLTAFCDVFRTDLESGVIKTWLNVSAPGDRLRKADLLIGEPGPEGEPPKKPNIGTKRPDIGTKRPYFRTKRPYSRTKRPYSWPKSQTLELND